MDGMDETRLVMGDDILGVDMVSLEQIPVAEEAPRRWAGVYETPEDLERGYTEANSKLGAQGQELGTVKQDNENLRQELEAWRQAGTYAPAPSYAPPAAPPGYGSRPPRYPQPGYLPNPNQTWDGVDYGQEEQAATPLSREEATALARQAAREEFSQQRAQEQFVNNQLNTFYHQNPDFDRRKVDPLIGVAISAVDPGPVFVLPIPVRMTKAAQWLRANYGESVLLKSSKSSQVEGPPVSYSTGASPATQPVENREGHTSPPSVPMPGGQVRQVGTPPPPKKGMDQVNRDYLTMRKTKYNETVGA